MVIAVLLLFGGTYYAARTLRYKYWHFYVHNGLTFLSDDDFRELLKKYKNDHTFASTEGKDVRGIIVTYPIKNHPKYFIQLRLEKNLQSNSFMFRAEIAAPQTQAHYDTGNPPIYMEIPMQYFEKVINEGLTGEQLNSLITTASKEKWKSTKPNAEIRLQPPIVLEYK